MRNTYLILLISLVAFFSGDLMGRGVSGEFCRETTYPRFVKSRKAPVKVPKGQTYTFGYLEVLENRSRPDGNIVRLPLYIFKSRGETPAKDPLVFITGGPGSTALRNARWMKYWWYLEDRDLILIEQRGTGYSDPCLDCREMEAAWREGLDPALEEEEREELEEKALKACRERWREAKIELGMYQTDAIVTDLEEMRQVLGYDQLNLLAISYGTKIAQAMMAKYPTSVRSAVLDSPMPLEARYDEVSAKHLKEAWGRLWKDWREENPGKRDLEEEWKTYLEGLVEEPLQLSITNPASGGTQVWPIGPTEVLACFNLSKTGSIPQIPRQVAALIDGDTSWLVERLGGVFQVGTAQYLGMRLSVWCAEESPYNDWAAVDDQTELGPVWAGIQSEVFRRPEAAIWDVPAAPEYLTQPLQTDIPVLLIVGTYDPDTPVNWARQLHDHLPNSHLFVFPRYGHVPTMYWDNPAAMALATDFFNQPYILPSPRQWEELKIRPFAPLSDQ